MTALAFHVIGDPAPKGSGRAMMVAGRAVHVPSGSKTNERKIKGWASAVSDAYRDAAVMPPAPGMGHRHDWPSGPVAIGIVFRFRQRRADVHEVYGAKSDAPVAMIVKPDADKLVRTTLDALTAAGAWRDDSQAALIVAAKIYVPDGAAAGATIVIDGLGEDLAGAGTVLERVGIDLMAAATIMRNAKAMAAAKRQDTIAAKPAAKRKRAREEAQPTLPIGADDFGGGA